MQLALSCRAPLGAAPCADPAALRGCCGGAVSAAPSRAPLYRELPQELQRPTQRPVELSSLPFFFSGGGSCRKDRTRPPLSAGAAPLREARAAMARPPRGPSLPSPATPRPRCLRAPLPSPRSATLRGWLTSAEWAGRCGWDFLCWRSAAPVPLPSLPAARVPLSPRRRDPHPPGSLLSGWIYIVMCKLQDAQQHWKEV